MLEIRDLCVDIIENAQSKRVINSVSFSIRDGEAYALVGESGCGKSLTGLSVIGLLPASARVTNGSILLDGKDLTKLSERSMTKIRGSRIGIIFQEPSTSLNPVMRIGDQISEVLYLHGTRGENARAKVEDLLAEVGFNDPWRYYNAFPHQISGGQKQRAMIAIALAGDPELIIADEPTTALDATIQKQVLELLKKLQKKRSLSLLFITHDLGLVRGFCSRTALMYHGEIVEEAEVSEFFANPLHPYAKSLLRSLPGAGSRNKALPSIAGIVPGFDQKLNGCAFSSRCPVAAENCRRVHPELKDYLKGHGARCLYAGKALPEISEKMLLRQSGRAVLRVEDLNVSYDCSSSFFMKKMRRAVSGVCFELKKGQTLALVGESGSGKTTTVKALLGILEKNSRTEGRIYLEGNGPEEIPKSVKKIRMKAQMIFQDPFASLDPTMSVGECIAESMRSDKSDPILKRKKIQDLLRLTGLPEDAMEKFPHEFSGGQRQRIAIARAIAAEPDIIFCDEPTSSLDVSVQAQILNLMREIQKSRNIAYLFITHNLSVVEHMADEVLVMKDGRIIERGSVQKIFTDPENPYTQDLLKASARV